MVSVQTAHDLIDRAIEEYKLVAVYALFSGGHDSLTNTHVCATHPKFGGVIHIDTGTGLPETRAFVEETCERYGWPLIVKKPFTTYEMLIVKYGFPGADSHNQIYQYLKGRPLVEASKEVKRRYREANSIAGSKPLKIGYLTGVRTQESQRRMGHFEPIDKRGSEYWINPIHDWTKTDCLAYLKAGEVTLSQVVQTLHMSGECFCGAYAAPEEKRFVSIFYPDQGRRIEAWETLVKTVVELGLAAVKPKHCQWGWEHGTPNEQLELIPLPMCHYCRGGLMEEDYLDGLGGA